MFRSFFCFVLAFNFFWGFALTTFSASEGDKGTAGLLLKAWEEYGFQAWGNANSLFEQALEDPKASKDQIFQARIGLAFITNYQTPGYDYDEAIELYQKLLKDLPQGSSPMRLLVLRSLAKSYLEHPKNPNVEKATNYFQKLFKLDPNFNNLITQEAAVTLLSSYASKVDRESYEKGKEFAKTILPRIKDKHLGGMAYAVLAKLCFFTNDLVGFEKALEKQYLSGIANRSILSITLFKIARLNEVEFKNYKKAAKYYRLLAKEVATSGRAYFANMRADELEKGQIKSDISPVNLVK